MQLPLLLLLLLGLTSATPTPTENDTTRPTPAWPSPTPAAGSAAYASTSWPPPVLRQSTYVSADFTLGDIPDFIGSPEAVERVPRAVVIYGVIKANPADATGAVAHTLALVFQQYVSVAGGWASEGERMLLEAVPYGGRNVVAWVGVGRGYTMAGLMEGGEEAGLAAAGLLAGQLQQVREEWFRRWLESLRGNKAVFQLN
ncbi:MAG: hypothetical protein M1829_002253 [Trizodia sp. TS-e1964]|nr:MAG: hypothetical protein M1829_002253 [Trizodia sp. TS-e1964]